MNADGAVRTAPCADRTTPFAGSRDRLRGRMSTGAVFGLVLLAMAAAGGAEIYSVWRAHQQVGAVATAPATNGQAAPASNAATAGAPAPARSVIEGALDQPAADSVIGPKVALSGWAIGRPGLRAVEARMGELRVPARLGIARSDVAAAKPRYPEAARAGFEIEVDLTPYPAPDGMDRRELAVVAIGSDGHEQVLGRRSVIEPAARTRWAFLHARGPVFHLMPALSGIGLGGAAELDHAYDPYLSATTAHGMRVPILYLRQTFGQAKDWNFDPGFDIERRCGQRRIAEDNLARTLEHAEKHRIPVLITLNGGIWADAACDVPAWDVNDHLEQDPANCQWNEHGKVMADDYLRHLPGSQDAPELARSLTLNVYARAVRHYKKRNLQQAARYVVAFMRRHPELIVGVNLDPDVYENPFFNETQWYDYNPGTLRQFREWLSGTGPYAGVPRDGAPDLRAYRRKHPLTLAQAGRLAGKRFARWADVDPPRAFPRDPAHPFWKDPWVYQWEMFRRHLVKLHYDELSEWLVAVGMPRDRIWSSQGLMAPLPGGTPFALHLDSPMRDSDSGGMSVEGSIPRDGHLGVILYGLSALNDVPMENGRSLFTTLMAMDPGFGVVEYNTADLRHPKEQPTYAGGYRSLRDLWNAGARYISPMAWNGSNGLAADQPDYVTFTAWRNTPLEDAARDFLLARMGLPLGARLWTFGTPRHADGDAWVAEAGSAGAAPGKLVLAPDAQGRVALVSPGDLALPRNAAAALVLGVPATANVQAIGVEAQVGGKPEWVQLAHASGSALRREEAGLVVPLAGTSGPPIDRLRIAIDFGGDARARPRELTRVAVLPPTP
jgi:hypothetical protein